MESLNNSAPRLLEYLIGSIAKFDCKPGFVQLYANNPTVNCTENDGYAVWSGLEFLVDCVPDYCQLPNMSHSNATLSHILNAPNQEKFEINETKLSNFSSSTILVYKCKEGFTYYEKDTFNLTCYMTQWNGSNSSCWGKLLSLSWGHLAL